MNIVLWVVQVLLALAFFAHGWLFLFPPAAVAEQMNASLPRWFQLFLGVAEVLAAVGLTLPGVTRIMPWLVDGRGGRDHDRDRVGNRVSSGAGRDELRGHHAAAVGDGHVRRVHAASGAAHRRPPRRVGTKRGPAAPVALALHPCGAVVSLPFAMVAPFVDPDSLPSIRPDGVPAIDIESPAFDRPLRIGVLLDGLTVPRWVAKILQDIGSGTVSDVVARDRGRHRSRAARRHVERMVCAAARRGPVPALGMV